MPRRARASWAAAAVRSTSATLSAAGGCRRGSKQALLEAAAGAQAVTGVPGSPSLGAHRVRRAVPWPPPSRARECDVVAGPSRRGCSSGARTPAEPGRSRAVAGAVRRRSWSSRFGARRAVINAAGDPDASSLDERPAVRRQRAATGSWSTRPPSAPASRGCVHVTLGGGPERPSRCSTSPRTMRRVLAPTRASKVLGERGAAPARAGTSAAAGRPLPAAVGARRRAAGDADGRADRAARRCATVARPGSPADSAGAPAQRRRRGRPSSPSPSTRLRPWSSTRGRA